MSKKLYVGNLPFTSTEEELRELFGRHGTVDSVSVIPIVDSLRSDGVAAARIRLRPLEEGDSA